mmetsp:Transcript_13020/g.37126  ORF Transcript_13020/g.37126 Transcript_13020/m.37126 type:complete len:211 (-) Transcript_13020:591-1223(-)
MSLIVSRGCSSILLRTHSITPRFPRWADLCSIEWQFSLVRIKSHPASLQSHFIISRSPSPCAAQRVALHPNELTVWILHPREHRYFITSKWPCHDAQQKAVVPSTVVASISALHSSSRYRTTSRWPFLDAQCRAVLSRKERLPSWPTLGQHLQDSIRYFTTSKWPPPADQWRKFDPLASVAVTGSSPVSRNDRIRFARSPFLAHAKGFPR